MDANIQTRRRPSLASMIVWVLFCFVMWAWAIMCPLVIVFGVIQMLFEPPWLGIEMGTSRAQQLQNLGSVAAFAALGLAFVVLRLRGHIRFGDRD